MDSEFKPTRIIGVDAHFPVIYANYKYQAKKEE